MKFLLVGDSKDLSQTIPLILKVRWPELSLIHATEAREAVNLIHREQPGLVILHLNSTLVDCFDLIAQIRGFSDVPLVVFSDSNDVVDKVRALEMGADSSMPWLAISMSLWLKVLPKFWAPREIILSEYLISSQQ